MRGTSYKRKAVIAASTFVFAASVLFGPPGAHEAHAGVLDAIWGGIVGVVVDPIVGGIFNLVTWLLFLVAAWLFEIVANMFDTAMAFSLDSAQLKLPPVKEGWVILRDFANIAFIFILLYIGIATILQFANFNTKKVLATLVAVALLVNFSFFFSGVVIDASNLLALSLYEKVAPESADQSGVPQGAVRRDSPAGRITAGIELANMVDPTALDTMTFTQRGVSHLLGALVLLASAFVILSGAILFILRTVALMFVLMLSPIAFAAAILPATMPHWNRWLHALIHYSFVAPVYLLLIWIVILIIEGGGGGGLVPTKTSLGEALQITDSEYDVVDASKVFLNYVVMLGLIAGSFTVARSMAGNLATISVRWSGRVVGAGAMAVGFGMRKTVGKKAYERTQDQELATRAAAGDRGARLQLAAAKRLAKASFDIRGGPVGEALGTGAAAVAGTRPSFGRPGGRGGYEEGAKKREREAEETARKAGEERPITAREKAGLHEESRMIEDLAEYESRLAGAQKELEDARAKLREEPLPQNEQKVEQAEREVEMMRRQVDLAEERAARRAGEMAGELRRERETEAQARQERMATAFETRGAPGLSEAAAAKIANAIRRRLAETPEEKAARETFERAVREATRRQRETEGGQAETTPKPQPQPPPQSGGGTGQQNA